MSSKPPEYVLYEKIKEVIAYCFAEFDIGPMTALGVLSRLSKEYEIRQEIEIQDELCDVEVVWEDDDDDDDYESAKS